MENILRTENLSIKYGKKTAVKKISLDVAPNKVTAIIGPSGCGKSTFLRALNRMHDLYEDVHVEGSVLFKNKNLYDKALDPAELRKSIGMVFQKPNPFPKSIFKNISWGMEIHGDTQNLSERVQDSLEKAALWDEVKDRLNDPASALSGGQQQRLCLARSIALNPEIILMDEPCSALDPRATARIENLILELKKNYTIIIVTHNMQQASRISDSTAFFFEGELVEFGATKTLFTKPQLKQTEDYITGRFG